MHEDLTNSLETFITQKVLQQPKRAIKPDEPLLSSGLIDSFSLMDLALFVEDQFGVRIDDTELNAETFNTLKELANLIAERRG